MRSNDLSIEFNLSEITFPYDVQKDSYSVRIFTPGAELPFAGHVSHTSTEVWSNCIRAC